uniref:Integrin alpha-2 domain-containing protein n=1 Tax=Periophthalmus magnuspinnatus TaxID=409849 RepID=A0A3B4B8F7_9GOBI
THLFRKKTSIAYLWIYSWIAGISCFNIETEHALQKHGDPDSLFGFSIAFHQQLSPTRKNLLLVGAPQSKHQHHENATGVVYKCELGDASQNCQPIQFDNEGIEWIPGQYVPHVLTGQCYLLGDDLRAGGEERTWRRVVCDSQHLLSRRMDHEWFAYCQQGHGATFAKDNTSVIFGAPGAYQWKGIVRMEPLDNTDIDSEDPRETGDVNQFNPKLIPLHRSSYLGFSIDTGLSLVRKGELTIVSGAPRGGYSGQVTFLKVDPVARKNLSVEFILSGPGLASSFGYDLAVVDLNGDGWDDLVVGAPQYFVKDGEVGGAVYIYINNKGTNWGHTNPIQLLGHTDSMFGLAVENIGDINQDGFGDIAVGAPYEGSGRVYIYCGSSKGINQKSAQVISPASDTVTLFGYSLSGNMDVDNNHYPDLAVGALSGTVFVYRSKPVVSISISLKVTPNTIDITKEQCQTQTCYFTAKACYRYTANLETFNPKLLLNYTFEADSERRKVRLSPRMDFLDPNRGLLELPAQNVEKCTTTRLKLVREITDKLRKIPISVTISLVSSSPSLQTSQSDLSPITLINTGCGLDNVCQSQLAIEYKFCSVQKQKNNGLAVITPSDGDIALEITATNRNGDDAHQSGLIVSHIYVCFTLYRPIYCTNISCTANKKGTLINCELGNPLQRDGEVTFYVILATSGISLSTKHVNITLLLETTSEQLIRPVEAFARVMFELKLQYLWVKAGKITNLGRPLKSFANISLNIFWPKENAVGKWLLYLTHISSKGVQPSLCSPATEINPLKEIKVIEGELEPLSTEDILFQPLKRTHKTLTCSDGLGCVEIRCPLHGLDSNAFIMLHSYLWNTTFTEVLHLFNRGKMMNTFVLTKYKIILNKTVIYFDLFLQVKLTVFLEKEVEYLTKVAWWIILLTVIALLLLLVFATFIMCKVIQNFY